MYINFRSARGESLIKNTNLTKENKNIFYLFEKNLFFGRRYCDFMVIVDNIGYLIKKMDLNKELKDIILKTIYLLNDIKYLIADEDLDGDELLEDMLNKLKGFKFGEKEYDLKLTLNKVIGNEITTDEHKQYLDYTKLSFSKMRETKEPLDMSKLNYIIDDGVLKCYTNINERYNFWAISLLDSEEIDEETALFNNLKDMLFNGGNLSRDSYLVHDEENNIIYSELTIFLLHEEIIHAANQLLNALRYSLNCYSFKTKDFIPYDIYKIQRHIDCFYSICNRAYNIAKHTYDYNKSLN